MPRYTCNTGDKFEQVRVVDGVTRRIAVMQCHEPPGPKAMAWAQVVILVFNVEDAARFVLNARSI